MKRDQVLDAITESEVAIARVYAQLRRKIEATFSGPEPEPEPPVRPPRPRPEPEPPAPSADPFDALPVGMPPDAHDVFDSVRNADRSGYQVIQPGGVGSGVTYNASSGEVLERVIIKAGWGRGIRGGANRPGGALKSFRLDRFELGSFYDEWNGAGYDRAQRPEGGDYERSNGGKVYLAQRWGALTYTEKLTVLNGYFHDCAKEHFWYATIEDDTEFGFCWFERCGGQALQIVNRSTDQQGDPASRPIRGGATLHLHDLVAVECGHELFGASGGGAGDVFSVMLNDPREDGHLLNVIVERLYVEGGYRLIDETGGALNIRPSGTDKRWMFGDVVVRDFIVRLPNNDRRAMRLGGAERFAVHSGDLQVGGKKLIELDDDGKPCGLFEWHGSKLKGNVDEIKLRYRGDDVGWANRDYRFEDGAKVSG